MISTWTQRQIDLVDKWINEFNCIGTLVAYTSWGKSSGFAIPCITRVYPKSLIIVVPSIKLKEDWEYKLLFNKLVGEVIVINTAIKTKYKCELLVIDECHRVGAETFKNVFDTIEYEKLLCLTATIERQDGNHDLILEKAPLIDNVTLEEGLKMGWVDPFEVIKIPIELTNDESIQLNKLNEEYETCKKTLGGKNPMKQAEFYCKYVDLRKWCVGKLSNKVFFLKKLESELGKERLDKLFDKYWTKPDKTHPYYLKARAAIKFYNIVAKRKDLLYNAQNKLSKTLELIEQYKDQYKFVFSQRIEFLEELSKLLPSDEHRLYHSKMKKKDKSDSFDWFNDGRTKCKTLLSVKSLIEGTDIPKLSVGVFTSYTSSQIDAVQGVGRILRKYKNKRAVIIYLYVPLTQEQVWLDKLKLNN
ncbi:MAG: DEAD/DEAH box helicase family protein [Candidatus Omnitrophica bacterium]|jgi:superfamily II DNA or RNA helicase|nr:DEAD/DEAH box helicase family protein [Candidatus Omnitrophota bacterium]